MFSPDGIARILDEKPPNPMLGLLGAYLLLLKSQTEEVQAEVEGSLRIVVRNLRRLLGWEHPDVEALALKLKGDQSSFVFQFPPMLRRSWDFVVEATIARPELVPANSLAEEISDRLTTAEPWLIWADPAECQVLPGRALVFSVEEQHGGNTGEISPLEEALRYQLQTRKGTGESPMRGSSQSQTIENRELDEARDSPAGPNARRSSQQDHGPPSTGKPDRTVKRRTGGVTQLVSSNQKGGFPKLNDRDDLWTILWLLTERRANDRRRAELAAKRCGGRIRGDSAFPAAGRSSTEVAGLNNVADRSVTPNRLPT